MHKSILQTAVVLAAVSMPCALADAQGGFYVDASLGFKIKPPSGWTYLGQHGDRGALRALYCATRDFTPKAGGAPHTPMMRVLYFAGGAGDGEIEGDGFPKRTPYVSFTDYQQRVYGPLTREKESTDTTYGGFGGRLVRSHAAGDDTLTLYTFVFPHGDGEVAIELEVLTEELGKMKGAFERALKSLAAHEATPTETGAAPPWVEDYVQWRELDAASRRSQRAEWGKRWAGQQKARKEPGWKTRRSGPFIVISRADSKSTKRITDAAIAGHKWADKRLGAISDDVVMPAVLRIFADSREHTAYRSRESRPRAYHAARREIYFYKDADTINTGTGFGLLLRGVLQHYLSDKDPGIVDNQPRWIDLGMAEYLRSTKVSKKKVLEFTASNVEMGRIAWYASNNRQIPALWDLIQELIQPSPERGAVEDPWGYVTECARLIRWFDAGGGAAMGVDDFLVTYYRAIGTASRTAPPDPAFNVEDLRLEDSQRIDLRKAQYKRRDDFLRAVNSLACPLSEDKWRSANEAWLEFNAKCKQ